MICQDWIDEQIVLFERCGMKRKPTETDDVYSCIIDQLDLFCEEDFNKFPRHVIWTEEFVSIYFDKDFNVIDFRIPTAQLTTNATIIGWVRFIAKKNWANSVLIAQFVTEAKKVLVDVNFSY